MKTSPAFGRRRFHQKTRTTLFCSLLSFFSVVPPSAPKNRLTIVTLPRPHQRVGARQQPPKTADRQLRWATPCSGRANMTFVVTRPPASRQILAATLSEAHPRLSSTPVCAHAAQWWPQESSGRPHRQERTVKGRCSRRRRNKRIWKRWDSKHGTQQVGHVVKVQSRPWPALGPQEVMLDLGQFDLGQFDLGQFELGQFELGQFELGQFELGQFELGQFWVAQKFCST